MSIWPVPVAQADEDGVGPMCACVVVRLSTSGERITVDAAVPVGRRVFGMTWSPLGMAAATALLVVHAQFTQKS